MSEPILPDSSPHRLLLPDGTGQWSLWRSVCLRGAGFPLADVLQLASPASAAAADRLRATEAEAEELRGEAQQKVVLLLQEADRSALDELVKAVQKLKKGGLPKTVLPADAQAAVERFAAARERLRSASEAYLATFAAEESRLSRVIRDAARDDRFREAVLWQNRRVVRTGFDSLLRRDVDRKRTSKHRQNEQVIAAYLQRFCTKNDTIGFFGPVGWAILDEGGEPIRVRHSQDLLAERRVYFEGWCIDAISDRMCQDPALRSRLAPRRDPSLRIGGAAGGGPDLSPESLALLAACDGETPAREVAGRLVAAGTFADEEAVYGAIDELCAAGLLLWGFEVPTVMEPDRHLRRQVERLADDGIRETARRLLAELEEGRQAVSRAAGDPGALDRALDALETRFTELTGRDSTRGHGQTYAGRTLVYEDCRRSTEVDLGPGFLAEIAAPLSLLLTSARWLTHVSAERHRELYRQAFEDLRGETGAARIELPAFCRRVLPKLLSIRTSPVRQEVVPQFQARWSEVLALPEDARRVSYTSDELRPRVLQAFAAPRPGWPMARYHSPDLLVVAEGPEAIRRGDYQLVLGEVHVGSNTLGTNLFMARHPSPGELLAAYDRDVPEPCVVPVLPKIWRQEETDARLGLNVPGTTGRLDFGLMTAKDFRLEIIPASPDLPRSQVLSIADLVVEDGDAGLEVVDPKGGRRFDLLDFLQMALTAQTVGAFKLLGSRPHSPRITIDRLIVARESWRCRTDGMEFVRADTEAERFAGARRWAESLGMPRFLFARTPLERKPFYLDLDSPISVEIFAKEVRRTFARSSEARVAVSEMVPGLSGAWLPDAQGRRYASELRFVAVDRTG